MLDAGNLTFEVFHLQLNICTNIVFIVMRMYLLIVFFTIHILLEGPFSEVQSKLIVLIVLKIRCVGKY